MSHRPAVAGRHSSSLAGDRPGRSPDLPRPVRALAARPEPPADLASRSRLISNQRRRTRAREPVPPCAGAPPRPRRDPERSGRRRVRGLGLGPPDAAAGNAHGRGRRRSPPRRGDGARGRGDRAGNEPLRSSTSRPPRLESPSCRAFAARYVVRHLPGRVTILVEEREPYALVNAGGLHWVDADGYLVTADARPGAIGLPILTGIGAPAAGAGRAVRGLRAGLAVLHVLQRTSDAPRRARLRGRPLSLARPRALPGRTGSRFASAPTAGATG